MTLYEFLKSTDNTYDTYDTDYDVVVTVNYIDEENDFYDKFCMGLIKKVEFVKTISSCEAICKWSELIENNINVFKEFTEQNWTRQYADDLDEFIYQWIKELHYWIAGYVNESTYKDFVENYLPRID